MQKVKDSGIRFVREVYGKIAFRDLRRVIQYCFCPYFLREGPTRAQYRDWMLAKITKVEDDDEDNPLSF